MSTGNSISPELRTFGLTLHFYSPAAMLERFLIKPYLIQVLSENGILLLTGLLGLVLNV